MSAPSTNPSNSPTQKSVDTSSSNFNFDQWAQAVRQQMLQALQNRSQINNPSDEDEFLQDSWDDDESE